MKTAPFNSENFEGTAEQIATLNEAYALAAERWFNEADPENIDQMRQLHSSLCNRIGNAFSDGLDATDIAIWATTK